MGAKPQDNKVTLDDSLPADESEMTDEEYRISHEEHINSTLTIEGPQDAGKFVLKNHQIDERGFGQLWYFPPGSDTHKVLGSISVNSYSYKVLVNNEKSWATITAYGPGDGAWYYLLSLEEGTATEIDLPQDYLHIRSELQGWLDNRTVSFKKVESFGQDGNEGSQTTFWKFSVDSPQNFIQVR